MANEMKSQPKFQAGLISTAEMFLSFGLRNLSFREDQKKPQKTCRDFF